MDKLVPADRLRILSRLWTGWAAPIFLLTYVAVATFLAFERHRLFQTSLFDLGYYTQVLWNSSQGRWFANSLKQSSYLADHFSPLLGLLAPLFRLAPDARTLLFVETLLLVSAIIPAYLILRRRHPTLAPLLVLAFVLNPFLHQMNVQEFHEIMLAVPALALALYGLARERGRWLLLGLALALLVREDMAVYVGSFGLYLALFRPRFRRHGLLAMVIAAAWFLLATRLLIPALGEEGYIHGRRLSRALADTGGLPEALLTTPLLSRANAHVIGQLLLPLAGLPLLGAGTQLLWLPALLALLFLAGLDVSNPLSWQAAPLLAPLWGTAALLLARPAARRARPLVVLLALATLVGFFLWSPFLYAVRARPSPAAIAHSRVGHSLLDRIPPDAPVVAQSGLGAHLAARRHLALFPWFEPEPGQYIILNETAADTYPMSPEELRYQINRLLLEPDYRLAWQQDGYYLFVFEPGRPMPGQGPWQWGEQMRLEGYELAQTNEAAAFMDDVEKLEPGKTLRVDLYWTALAPMPANYSVSVRLAGPDRAVLAQSDNWPARGSLGTSTWEPGRTIRDSHVLALPAALPLEVELRVIVYEPISGDRLPPGEGHTLARLRTRTQP